ncbi:hypothetical protein [Rhodoferax saidenbachensis]|nr:hypothetical protein [Rhodoferax saidenbachensis]
MGNDEYRAFSHLPDVVRRSAIQADVEAKLKQQFAAVTFIYGTVGPKAMHYGNRGNPAAVAARKWYGKGARAYAKKAELRRPGFLGAYKPSPENFREPFSRLLKLYDPGPRTAQYIKGDMQMMDMYYGMDNSIHLNRNRMIAEFVHCTMEFTPEFNFNDSGKTMYEQTFPGAGEGYLQAPVCLEKYGQSATMEMSKIIREGIRYWGGKLVYEGKAVFYSGVFSLAKSTRDTDVEAQNLFTYFGPRASSSTVPFGKGTLEFQWGGEPTTPTKALFLTNWSFSGGALQSIANAPSEEEIRKLLSAGHGLRHIWNNFEDFPPFLRTVDPETLITLFGDDANPYGAQPGQGDQWNHKLRNS